MRQTSLLAFALLLIQLVSAQNLVLNHSFENHNYAPCDISADFNELIIDWDAGNENNSSDVMSSAIPQVCYNYQPNSTYSGPISQKGRETASQGKAFAGIWVYTIYSFEQREYLRGELSTRLEAGQSYEVSLQISLADFMESYVGELGIAFMETDQVNLDGELILADPQILITEGLDVSDGWYTFETTFVSDGDYQYFIIGNFNTDDQTLTLPNPSASGESSTYGAYYYIDNVHISPASISSTTSLDIAGLIIYPTLVDQSIFIKSDEVSHLRYAIIDQLGRVSVDGEWNGAEQTIDCSDLHAGIYYLVLRDANGVGAHQTKFVKVR